MIEILHTIANAAPIQANQVQNLPMPSTDGVFQKALAVTFAIIGAFALLMITVSGLRYILSGGDSQKIARAKDGIIYSLVGIAVAITAEAIVHFVVGNL